MLRIWLEPAPDNGDLGAKVGTSTFNAHDALVALARHVILARNVPLTGAVFHLTELAWSSELRDHRATGPN